MAVTDWTADVRIDNVSLVYRPAHVQVIEPEVETYPGPGLGKQIVQPLTPGAIELMWGPDAAQVYAVDELRQARGMRIHHMLSFYNEQGTGRMYHRNVAIPLIGYGQGFIDDVNSFTLTFEEFRPIPSLVTVPIHFVAAGSITFKTPAGGKVWGMSGYGPTGSSVQVVISGNNVFDTPPSTGTDGLLGNGVLNYTNNRMDRNAELVCTLTGGAPLSAILELLMFPV